MLNNFAAQAREIISHMMTDIRGECKIHDYDKELKGLESDTFESLLALHQAEVERAVQAARIEENQIPLDRINNYKPNPAAPSFGSANGALETAGWRQYFENRISALRADRTAPGQVTDKEG